MSRSPHASIHDQPEQVVAGVSWIRKAETDVLLRAIRALRLEGILSEAEYQAKRQRLVARL